MARWFQSQDVCGEGRLKPAGTRALLSLVRKAVLEHAVGVAQRAEDERQAARLAAQLHTTQPRLGACVCASVGVSGCARVSVCLFVCV